MEFINLICCLTFFLVIPGLLASLIAHNKGRSTGVAFALGFFLNFLGVFIVLLWSNDKGVIQTREVQSMPIHTAQNALSNYCNHLRDKAEKSELVSAINYALYPTEIQDQLELLEKSGIQSKYAILTQIKLAALDGLIRIDTHTHDLFKYLHDTHIEVRRQTAIYLAMRKDVNCLDVLLSTMKDRSTSKISDEFAEKVAKAIGELYRSGKLDTKKMHFIEFLGDTFIIEKKVYTGKYRTVVETHIPPAKITKEMGSFNLTEESEEEIINTYKYVLKDYLDKQDPHADKVGKSG